VAKAAQKRKEQELGATIDEQIADSFPRERCAILQSEPTHRATSEERAAGRGARNGAEETELTRCDGERLTVPISVQRSPSFTP